MNVDARDSEARPLPQPPRCRGIPLSNGDYTGCAFGYGDIPPFTHLHATARRATAPASKLRW
jgi:hypothetical protein